MDLLLDISVSWTTIKKISTNSSDTLNENNSNGDHYDENIRNNILEASLQFVPEYGWSKQTLIKGAECLGYPGITHGIFTKGGADLVHYFQQKSNMKLVEILKGFEIEQKTQPIPPVQFVEKALKCRLEMLIPYLNKWPQAIAIMSLPPNVPNALASILTAVDDICYYSGDRSVDINWYIRRIGIAGIYKTTELYLVQDSSPEYKSTWQFLNRRLLEAVQIHDLVCKSDISNQGAKDTITSAFVTARNILGVNWTR